ncbi:MAG TPA: hypothetical protein VGI39_00140 [Polyangiaceae bacterium]|jgi:hypothetical protein
MPEPFAESRLDRLVPWIAGAVVALPVLLAHYPPMADLPLHEAIIGILRHWGDPRFVPPDVYKLNLGHANQLFYFLILPLTYVLPIGTATKLIVAAALFFLPVSVGRVARYLGVTQWTAAIIAPIALGWMFFWGLLANFIGLDFYLLALPTFDRFCQRATGRGLLACALWVILLHYAHDLLCLTAGGTIILFILCDLRGWKENLVRLVPPILVVALAATSAILTTKQTNAYHATLRTFEWYPFLHKLTTIPGVLYAGYEWWVRTLIFVVCLAPMLLLGLDRWTHRTPKARTWREWLHDYRFEVLCASLFFSYFVAPVNIKGTTLIYHRFLAPAWILLTFALCRPGHEPSRLARLLAALVPIAPLLTAWPRFAHSDGLYEDLDAAITHMAPGSTYAVLELGPIRENWLYSPVTGGGHIVANLGGRGFFDFTFSESSPVYQRLDRQWATIYARMDGHSYRMMPAYDFTHFRYVVLHTTDVNIANVAVLALQPEGRFIFRQGEWTVVESTVPLVPIDSPDEPTPEPHPKTLRKRCLEVRDQILAMPVDEQSLPPESQPALQPAPQ